MSEMALGGILDFFRHNGYKVGYAGSLPELELKGSRIEGVMFQFLAVYTSPPQTRGTKWHDMYRVDDPDFFGKLGRRLNQVRRRARLPVIDHEVPNIAYGPEAIETRD
jgi:hypothetical protein